MSISSLSTRGAMFVISQMRSSVPQSPGHLCKQLLSARLLDLTDRDVHRLLLPTSDKG